MFAAYEGAAHVCLAERLLTALEAGARAGGDRRCVPQLGSLSAFLAVARPDDTRGEPSLRLTSKRPGERDNGVWEELRRHFRPEPGSAEESPVRLLRHDLDAERSAGRLPDSCR